MALTAPLLSERQALYPFKTGSELSSGRTKAHDRRLNVSSLFAEGSFYAQPIAFYYKNRARLHFSLTEAFEAHFILVKGLIEFHRPGYLKFVFHPDKKGFEIDLEATRFTDLSNLLAVVYEELGREIRFKAALKKAIAFEKRYRLESAEVYDFSNAMPVLK